MELLSSYHLLKCKEDFMIHPSKLSTLYVVSKILLNINVLNDRFNILNNESEYFLISRNENIHDIWNLPYQTFEECCFRRVNEIIEFAKLHQKKIYISFSGGVDSTTIVSAFLLNDKLDKSTFYILYNDYSYNEYPLIFDIFKKEKINLINFGSNIFNLVNITKNEILVTGQCGDQLAGSNLHTVKFSNIVSYYDNWILALKKVYPYITDKHIFDIEQYVKYIGINNLKYFGQVAWAINFGCKYTHISEDIDIYTKCFKYYSFFDTKYFCRYSLSCIPYLEMYRQNIPLFYKQDWKKIIFTYTKDINYLCKKGKEAYYIGGMEASPGVTIKTSEKKLVIDDNPNSIYKEMINYIKPEFREYYFVYKK